MFLPDPSTVSQPFLYYLPCDFSPAPLLNVLRYAIVILTKFSYNSQKTPHSCPSTIRLAIELKRRPHQRSMTMMLLGTWEQPISPTGHLSLPPPWRASLSDGLIITRGFDGGLQAFPQTAWSTIARRIDALAITGAAPRTLRRMLFGQAASLALSPEGTLPIPTHLVTAAALSRRAVWVGLDTYAEIWSPDRWQTIAAQLATTIGSGAGPDLPALLASI